ncbi:MAG: hypothetical protein KBS54_06540 [Synergistaceae bacterium]|nr:hypothetical protein [Candidatus Equadaptatus faecalis]
MMKFKKTAACLILVSFIFGTVSPAAASPFITWSQFPNNSSGHPNRLVYNGTNWVRITDNCILMSNTTTSGAMNWSNANNWANSYTNKITDSYEVKIKGETRLLTRDEAVAMGGNAERKFTTRWWTKTSSGPGNHYQIFTDGDIREGNDPKLYDRQSRAGLWLQNIDANVYYLSAYSGGAKAASAGTITTETDSQSQMKFTYKDTSLAAPTVGGGTLALDAAGVSSWYTDTTNRIAATVGNADPISAAGYMLMKDAATEHTLTLGGAGAYTGDADLYLHSEITGTNYDRMGTETFSFKDAGFNLTYYNGILKAMTLPELYGTAENAITLNNGFELTLADGNYAQGITIANGGGKIIGGAVSAKINGDTALNGNLTYDGTITNTGSASGSKKVIVADTGHLTNEGTITASLDNEGEINGAGSLILNGDSVNNGTITQKELNVTDAGTLVTNIADLNITDLTVQNAGKLKLADTTAAENNNNITGYSGINGELEIDGNIKNKAAIIQDKITVNNSRELTNNGTIKGAIINNGTIDNSGDIEGTLDNNGTIKTKADNLILTESIINDTAGSRIIFTGGSNENEINGIGTTEFQGENINNADITQGEIKLVNATVTNTGKMKATNADCIIVDTSSELTTNADDLDGILKNNGTVNLTGGKTAMEIKSDTRGTLNLTGNTEFGAAVNNQDVNLKTGVLNTQSVRKLNATDSLVLDAPGELTLQDGNINPPAEFTVNKFEANGALLKIDSDISIPGSEKGDVIKAAETLGSGIGRIFINVVKGINEIGITQTLKIIDSDTAIAPDFEIADTVSVYDAKNTDGDWVSFKSKFTQDTTDRGTVKITTVYADTLPQIIQNVPVGAGEVEVFSMGFDRTIEGQTAQETPGLGVLTRTEASTPRELTVNGNGRKIDGNGLPGVTIENAGDILNLSNVTMTNFQNSVVTVGEGTHSTLSGVKFTNTNGNADVTNNGTLDIYTGTEFDKGINGTGTANVKENIAISNTAAITQNTINISNGAVLKNSGTITVNDKILGSGIIDAETGSRGKITLNNAAIKTAVKKQDITLGSGTQLTAADAVNVSGNDDSLLLAQDAVLDLGNGTASDTLSLTTFKADNAKLRFDTDLSADQSGSTTKQSDIITAQKISGDNLILDSINILNGFGGEDVSATAQIRITQAADLSLNTLKITGTRAVCGPFEYTFTQNTEDKGLLDVTKNYAYTLPQIIQNYKDPSRGAEAGEVSSYSLVSNDTAFGDLTRTDSQKAGGDARTFTIYGNGHILQALAEEEYKGITVADETKGGVGDTLELYGGIDVYGEPAELALSGYDTALTNKTGGKIILGDGIKFTDSKGNEDIKNDGQLYINGTVNLEKGITGSGNTVLDAKLELENGTKLQQNTVKMTENAELTANASDITTDNAVENEGTINFTGGLNENKITGKGTTNILGSVKNLEDIVQNTTVCLNAVLETSLDKLKGAIFVNEGETVITGGKTDTAIDGRGMFTFAKGVSNAGLNASKTIFSPGTVLNFIIDGHKAGDTILESTDGCFDLKSLKVKDYFLTQNENETILKEKGERITLINGAENYTGSTNEYIPDKIPTKGKALTTNYGMYLDEEEAKLFMEYYDLSVLERAKSLSEGRMAAISAINNATDLIADRVINEIGTLENDGKEWTSFVSIQGSRGHYETGSYIDMNGSSVAAGLAKKISANTTIGVFAEGGWSRYDSTNEFENFGTVTAKGDINHFGGGILLKTEADATDKGNLYGEASVRAGHISQDYSSENLLPSAKIDYDATGRYLAAHAAVGYNHKLKSGNTVDTYVKYLYAHQGGDDTTLSFTNEEINFKPVESHRVRAGFRYNKTVDADFKAYGGLAYEYEFSSNAAATTQGLAIAEPDLKGGTGVAELGLSYKKAGSPWAFDFTIIGTAGKRESIGANLTAWYEFGEAGKEKIQTAQPWTPGTAPQTAQTDITAAEIEQYRPPVTVDTTAKTDEKPVVTLTTE